MTSNMSSTGDALHQVTKSNPLPSTVPTPVIAPKLSNSKPNDPQMEQQLESLLSQLESPTFVDLDQVIDSLSRLNNILVFSRDLPLQTEKFIYEFYLKVNFDRIVALLCDKHYQLVIKNHVYIQNSEANPEIVARVQRIFSLTACLLTYLLRDFQFEHISRETLNKLFISMLQYLLWYRSTNSLAPELTLSGINGLTAYTMVKAILSGNANNGNLRGRPTVVPSLQIGLLTVVLGEFRKMIVDTMKQNIVYARLVSRANMAVDALASLIEYDRFTRFYFPQSTQYRSEFIYELYAMYELCIQIYNRPYLNNVQKVLNSIEYYVVCICRSLGDSIWMHFELVDKEIHELKLDPEQVGLFKFMAIGGFTRVAESTNTKSAKLISGQNHFEAIEAQEEKADPSDLCPSGIDPNEAILDFEEKYDGPVLEPTKIAVPKSTEEQVSASDTEEDGFEVLKVPEPKEPEVVIGDLPVNTFGLQDTKESDSVEASTTSGIENLSKEDREKMYAALQKMQQDLSKSEQMLSELLHKLASQKI